jgi:predicted phage tail protein
MDGDDARQVPGQYTEETTMQFLERTEGQYRIYVGAVEATGGDGYIAALVVTRRSPGERAPREAYRDTSLCAGYRWPTAHDALGYAVARAREMIRTEPQRLEC